MNVVVFPNSTRVTEATKGLSVVVAPRGRALVAYVETPRGWAVLEETTDHRHAFDDGFAYAARHDLPFRHQSHPFNSGHGPHRPRRGGTVYVTPSERHGGSWDVSHVSGDGAELSLVANRFVLAAAVAAGREIAKERGARFDDVVREAAPEGPSAA